MKKTFTFLILFLICSSGLIFGQTIINDFEAGSPTVVTRYGATFSVVANPNPIGNTTANCGKIGRTTGLWYELIAFPASYTVPASTTKYLHVLVNYPAQPDISVRFDAADETVDGATDVRALNSYTSFGQWQDLVFQLDGGASGATVNAIIFLPDVGFNNTPAGQVLNNTDAFGYVDEFTFSDSATPVTLSAKVFQKDSDFVIYPNPTQSVFKLKSKNNVHVVDVSLYNILGKKVVQNIAKVNKNEYDISGLSSGVYIVKITDDNGGLTTKRVIKK
tara:strand:+ start:1098 stop:1925 length:828 start_codon:yes stop_codon:yes gene_type:complete